MKTITDQLILHEGLKNFPYEDTTGHLTIGVGRNLDAKGISDKEAKELLRNDIQAVEKKLEVLGWFRELGRVRRKVIIDMCFNLGYSGLISFHNMISAIKNDNYRVAADEMLDSKWAEQVGKRATRLSKMMRTGEDYDDA